MDKRFLARLECYPMKYLLTLLIVLLIPTAALAKGECKEERRKFCAGMVKKELWDCLSKHEAELGAPCKTKIEARAKAKEERAVCTKRRARRQLFITFNGHPAAAKLS